MGPDARSTPLPTRRTSVMMKELVGPSIARHGCARDVRGWSSFSIAPIALVESACMRRTDYEGGRNRGHRTTGSRRGRCATARAAPADGPRAQRTEGQGRINGQLGGCRPAARRPACRGTAPPIAPLRSSPPIVSSFPFLPSSSASPGLLFRRAPAHARSASLRPASLVRRRAWRRWYTAATVRA